MEWLARQDINVVYDFLELPKSLLSKPTQEDYTKKGRFDYYF
jgi:hypothetical protein